MSWSFAWKAILQYRILVVVLLFCGIGGSLIFGIIKPAHYDATAQLTVQMAPVSSRAGSGSDPASDNEYVQAQLPTYLEYAQSQRVLKPVVDKLDLSLTPEQLRDHLDFSIPSDTLVVEITASWGSASGAADLANATASSFADRAPGFASDVKGTNKATANIFSPAKTPTGSGNNLGLRLGIGALAGAVVGILLAWVLKLRDPYVRSVTDISDAGAAPVLGLIPWPAQRAEPQSTMARLLRANLVSGLPTSFDELYARVGLADSAQRPQVITVVRATAGAASDVVAWRLACVAAASGLRTVVVTGDPAMHRYFNSLLSRLDARSKAPDLLPLNTITPPPGGIMSTAALDVALADVIPAADLVLIAAGSPLDDPNVGSQTDIAEAVIATTTPKAEHRVINVACERIRQSSDQLLGLVVIDRTCVDEEHRGTPTTQRELTEAAR